MVGVVIFVVAVDFTTETDSGFVLDFTVACPRITANSYVFIGISL